MGIFDKLKKKINVTTVDDDAKVTTHAIPENNMSDKICPQQGKIYTIANGFKSYEMYHDEGSQIFVFADILEKQLGFTMKVPPVIGWDNIFWDATKEDITMTIGWDNWSGAFVHASCSKGDHYIEQIKLICEKNHNSIFQLADLIKDKESHNLIAHSFTDIRLGSIDVVRFWTQQEYQQYLGIYRGKKILFSNELDAFLKLWLAELIECEEWYDLTQVSAEEAELIICNWFLANDSTCGDYSYHYMKPRLVDNLWAESWSNQAIADKCQLVNKRKEAGIYTKNGQAIDKENFSLKIDGIVKAIEIKHNPNWAGYRTLFIETEKEYLLISE